MEASDPSIVIRDVNADDLDAIIRIDEQSSGIEKMLYWHDAYAEYQRHLESRFFLVAERDREVLGFIMGEIRAWEFGSEPCGWVFAIGVKRDSVLSGIGSNLLDELCACFRRKGVGKLRTMTAKQEHELLSFFRSQGMMAGPYLQLEKDLNQ